MVTRGQQRRVSGPTPSIRERVSPFTAAATAVAAAAVLAALAVVVSGAKYPSVFGPPLEAGPVLATAGPNRGKPCVDCIFTPVRASLCTIGSGEAMHVGMGMLG